MSNLTLGSLFDGSGGFPLGGMLCGITPVWSSEIEPFPIRVTTKRLPFIKHYGDVSKINGADLEPVDIITFGSPCTDMSVAGKRAGLDGRQSVLFYQAIRIVKEMRCATNGKYPRWICWENVFGAFSSSGGADFKAVLEAVIGVVQPETEVPAPAGGKWPYADIYMGDGWSVAYRTVDAQFFGVPQRRRRIYLVADFAGECAGEILFERQGVSRDYPTRGNPWQGAASDAEDGAGAAGFGVDGYNSSVSDKAATLGVNCGMSTGRNGVAVNDRIASTLFAAYGTKWNGNEGAYSGGNFVFDNPYVLNDQGGQRIDVSVDKAATLRAEAHHPPCVMQSSGFCTEHSAKSRSVGYEEERSPTLRAGVVPSVAIENHPIDGRCKVSEDGKVQTLTSRMGTGGMNTPLVLDTPKTLKIRSGCEGGGKGALIQDNMSATLSCNNDQTVFVPTAYGICSDKSNSMLSDNPHSGIYEADTSRTLDANGGNPGCNQGGIAVVEPVAFAQNQRDEVRDLHGKSGAIPAQPGMKQQTYVLQGSMIGREDKNGPQGDGVDEDVSFTLNTIDRHAVAYSMTTGCYGVVSEEQTATLMARDFKDAPLVTQPYQKVAGTIAAGAHPSGFNGQDAYSDRLIPMTDGVDYIVRRLTPTECARLQGFPDWWCDGLGTDEPTEDEIAFWTEVWETHRRIVGTSEKPKSRKQIIKWLRHPHSDAAEYKMWGNGVALPCVCFVLTGIVENEDTAS